MESGGEEGPMAEIRRHWEVPAIAHFCSLFRTIFKLIDFDIEDLEEALFMDSTTKHSLIVDLLVSLLKGCTGRRDVTLLNYNQFLWDVVGQRWVEEGRGEERNPLGAAREKADFHSLPLYPKIKLLHCLCELRLQRPDVETLTKNLDGESLRVVALGKDDKGASYWYFYGTRLYKEEPEPLKLRLPKPAEDPPETPTPSTKRGRKGKAAGRGRKRKRSLPVEDDESEAAEMTPPSPPPKTPASSGRGRPKRSSTAKANKAKPEEPQPPQATPSRRSMRQAARRGETPAADQRQTAGADPDSEEESEAGGGGDTRASSVVPTSEAGTEDEAQPPAPGRSKLMMRVKARLREADEASRDSWREGSVGSASGDNGHGSAAPEKEDSRVSAPPEDDASNQDGEIIGNTTIKDMIDRMYSHNDDEDDEDSHPSTEASTTTPPETPGQKAKADEATPEPTASAAVKPETEDTSMDVSHSAEDKAPSTEPKEEDKKTQEDATATETPEVKMETEAVVEEDPTPAWDQPFLRPDTSQTERWKLCCSTLDEWRSLAEEMGKSRSKAEKALETLLTTDFLPEMGAMFETKAAERARREAELSRRTSERVEIRRLAEEAEREKLAKREAEERQRLEAMEIARRRRLEAEERERRRKEREKERDKAAKQRDRAKEDRSRRLQYRQQRQERIANGLPVPEELMHHPGQGYDEAEEVEMELDHAYGQLEKVIDALKKHPDAEPFLSPVTDDIAPDYNDRIEKPMCIETIEDKLIDRSYANKIEFVDDVNLIFLNCLEYNGLESEYTRLAKSFEKGFIRAWHKYFPPTHDDDTSERVRKENWACFQKLNALEKKVNELLRPKPVPPRPAAATYSLSPAQGPSATSSARTLPFSAKKATGGSPAASNLPPPARAPYGSNAKYRVYSTTANRPLVPVGTGGVAKFASNLRLKTPGGLTTTRFAPLGTRRVYMPPSSGAPRIVGPTTLVRRAGPMQPGTPAPGRVHSSFTPAPRTQIIRAAPPVQRPSVYLLPSSDGENRLLKFVTKNGEPASHDLIQHLLPQLKKEAHKLPKGLLTLTIDSQDVSDSGGPPKAADAPGPSGLQSPATAPKPEPAEPAERKKRGEEEKGEEERRNPQAAESGPPDLGPPQGKAEVGAQASPATAPFAGKRFYHIGDNSYLAIEDGNPYLYNKTDGGELVRVQQVSRDGLLEKLKRIQAQKGPAGGEAKPVCSVAPQLQPRQTAGGAAVPSGAILVPATSTVVMLPSRPPAAVVPASTVVLTTSAPPAPAQEAGAAPKTSPVKAEAEKVEEEIDINEFLVLNPETTSPQKQA